MRSLKVNWREQEEQLVQKAKADREFFKKLYADPRAVIRNALGVELPEDLKIHVLKSAIYKQIMVQIFQADDENLFLILSEN